MVKVCNFKSLPCCRGNKHKIGCVATFPSLFLTLSLTNKMNNILCFRYVPSVSHVFVTNFLPVFYLFSFRSSSNLPQLYQSFRQTLRRNLIRIRHRVQNLPLPTLPPSQGLLQWGIWANSAYFLQLG